MPIAFNKPIYLIVCGLALVVWIMINRSHLRALPRGQKFIFGGIRTLLILLLGLALSDPYIMTHSDRVNLFFCLDVSKSIGKEPKKTAETAMQKMIAKMENEDQAGLIVFGKQPTLEVSLRKNFHPKNLTSDINTNYTNIHDALQFAIGRLPQEGKNRIVLFTDGNENLQQGIDMAYLAASLGVEIYPVPLGSWFSKNEVYIKALETPSVVPLETPFEIRIVIVSSKENQGELILYRNDQLLANDTITLKPGKNVFTFADALSESGLYVYRSVGNFSEDVFFQNNEGLSFTRGARKSKILYLTNKPNNSHPFAKMLHMQGINLVHKHITDLPGSLHNLLDYNAIILDNVSGESVPYTVMENIEKYVKEMGGGLIMIGGDKSFGAGFYHKTPVEKALPVFMDAPTDLKFSALSLMFVIDKSSSMSASYKDKSKLEMAKIAAFSSIEMLNPTDRAGIVAFDTESKLVVPLTRATERQQIANKLSVLKEGGGTNLYPALEDAFRILKATKATKKHIIVLSDGLTEEADFETLVHAMGDSDISVSTVSIGTNSDLDLMKSIAQWGNGRSYYTDHPDNIPNIFTGETKIIAKNIIAEKTLQPVTTRPSEILQGLDTTELPIISGQIITYPKPGASVLIRTELGPLLATWRYGLGRSVAFTSDLNGRWGKQWVLWTHYGRFSSQIAKWAQRKESQNQFRVSIDRTGENGIFTVDVTNNQNRFLNYLNLNVRVLFPSKQSQTLSLDQIAPGRYQGEFPAEEIGDYYLSLFGEKKDELEHPQVYGFGIPYTEEFGSVGVNQPLLEQLASITNGKMVNADTLSKNLFTVGSDAKQYGTPIWQVIALIFLFLLIVDVAVRKLSRFTDR